jgi:hypothetical protein
MPIDPATDQCVHKVRKIMRVTSAIGSLLTAGLIFTFGSQTRADENLKFREFLHSTSVQTQEVGDADGHILGVTRYSGLASFPDGTTGTAYFVTVIDYTKGAGLVSGYYNLTLDDGSVLWFRSEATAKPDGAKTLFSGSVTVLGGKARFEGMKGDGSLSGERKVPLASGSDLYVDLAINLKK